MILPPISAQEIADALSNQIGQLSQTVTIQGIQIQKLMAELTKYTKENDKDK